MGTDIVYRFYFYKKKIIIDQTQQLNMREKTFKKNKPHLQ